jgi:hypothetical protein
MNLLGRGKIKFVFHSHVDKKNNAAALSDTESEQLAKPITSKLRQAVKPGRRAERIHGASLCGHAGWQRRSRNPDFLSRVRL